MISKIGFAAASSVAWLNARLNSRLTARKTVLVVACGAALVGTAQSTLAAGKTFVYCSEGSPSTFNPQMGTDGPTFNASSRTIYNRLVDFEKGGTRILPSLAESWSVSKDGKQYTFKLRKDVDFQTTDAFKPNRKFNADDVVFTFQRMLKKDHPFHKINGGVYEYFTSMGMDELIEDVKKVDPYTVQFVLRRSETPFLANMAMDFASILSAEYGTVLTKNNTPERIDTEPVGTGPFVFRKYDKDNQIRFHAHPTYFGGKQAIDNLVFSITPDPNVRYQKLKRGECHLIAEPPLTDLQAMRADGALQVLEQGGLNVGYLAMNVQKAPFNNVKVRKAINYALNRKSYLDAIYQGHASLAKNPIPPTMWSYNKSTSDYEYNPEKAKQLLKEAGVATGFSTKLWAMPVSRPYNPNGKKMAEMMQADLKKVGVQVEIVTYDWPTYLDKARKGEHEMLLMGWTGDNGDPDNFMNVLLGCNAVEGGSNYSRWCQKSYDSLISAARTTVDVKKRTEFYTKAQTIFKDEAPWVTLAHAKVFRAMRKEVTGYKMSPFGTDSFVGVDLKK
ncbi:MAG: ABC transporter substrate-binding protein [Bdellovibrionaceae bacterium]|nr:ABC transporter substrate-binding protein [Pseudobdellovibrionaceae bacterium]